MASLHSLPSRLLFSHCLLLAESSTIPRKEEQNSPEAMNSLGKVSTCGLGGWNFAICLSCCRDERRRGEIENFKLPQIRPALPLSRESTATLSIVEVPSNRSLLRSGQHYLFLGNQQPHSRSSKSQEIAFFSAIQDLHSRFFLEFSEFNNTIFHILTSPSSSVEFNTIFSHSYRRA